MQTFDVKKYGNHSGATQRVIQFIEKQGISKYKFCKDLGFSNKFLDNSSNMGTDKACKILHQFPDLNSEWLLTGIGEMLRSSETLPTATLSTIGRGIPLIPVDALASMGTGNDYSINFDHIEERYVVPDFEQVDPDFLIRVKGSSMTPKYNSGDILACKFIKEKVFIQWNKPHVLDTITQGTMVKRIKQSQNKDCYTLVSDNEKYPPFDIPLSEIRTLAIVVGVIRLE